ncbi:MAG TPA: histidinol dehydrogenase [Candidatus Sumerlaeota bacterium]|nr:histidinol dehydrogenase [Candidatus Sumerlaeota bacterium]
MRVLQFPKDEKQVTRLFARAVANDPATEDAVRQVIEQVRRRGDRAVAALTKRFDKVTLHPSQFEIPAQRLREAWEGLPQPLQKALQTARERIEAYHRKQLLKGFVYKDALGNRMEQRVNPVRRAGVYAPGGRASYPSTVLMDIVPARVAGVDEVILLTPPGGLDSEGGRAVLGAAWLAGVDRVISVGGTPGVVGLALGTETLPKVDIIVGPGNRFVATAKKLLYGEITIDMVAGPSEVLVLADETASPVLVAADLLAQAEHDPDAQAIAVLIGDYDVAALQREIRSQTAELPRRAIIEQSLKAKGALIRVNSVEEALALAEQKAPEHLELLIRDAQTLARRVRNVGAVFVGPYTPESMGDYAAGPNHTLPTGGTARFFSPLSVWSFLKTSHVLECSKKGFEALAETVTTLADAEGFGAHAAAVRRRLTR